MEPTALIEFLAPYPPEVQELTLQGRLALVEMLPNTSEIFYDANSAVCSGFTYTGKVSGNFVNLAVYADHVTLIFGFGVSLNDPENRLKGGGNLVRHIRLEGMKTLQDTYVIKLIQQASEEAPRPVEPVEPQTIVKVMAGKKRRPGPR